MPERISSALGISHASLDAAGVYDRFVDIDSQLHVDPHLLYASAAPEIAVAAKTLEKFWSDTILILQNIFEYGDRFWREALKRFTFPENPNIGLGYATGSTSGAAVGRKTAEGLVQTASEIVRAGITDPKIFELVGLFEPNVGPDLISDITVHVIESHLLQYTQRICADLGIVTKPFVVNGIAYRLPEDSSNDHLILLPKDILRSLPVAFSWEDIDKVCAYNEALRARLNAMIGENWRRATEDNNKQKLKQVLIENPAALTDLIQQYRAKPADPYDFARDVLGETIWLEEANKAAAAYPLDLTKHGPVTSATIMAVVRIICDRFRHLVEDCGLSRLFWTDEGKVRHERFAQLLFFGIADAYCRANNIDLSPEVNSGRGPVDFKLSKGYADRVLVEVKWSKNSKLVHGFEVQLEEYAKAEGTHSTVLLVIQVADSRASIDKIEALRGAAIRDGKTAPEIKVIDGRRKASASHLDDDDA
jgi:hypothetical protein